MSNNADIDDKNDRLIRKFIAETDEQKRDRIRDQIVLINSGLVYSTVKTYVHSSNDAYDDLVQEGQIGLIHAIKKFKPNKGAKFSTYAIIWIRQRILLALNRQTDHGGFYIPGHITDRLILLGKAEKQLSTRGCQLTLQSIAQKMNEMSSNPTKPYLFNPERVNDLINIRNRSRFLYSLDGNGTDTNRHKLPIRDVADPELLAEEVVIQKEREEIIRRLISGLPDAQQSAIMQRYGFGDNDPLTLKAIGKLKGYTKQRAEQIVKEALTRLRNSGRYYKEILTT